MVRHSPRAASNIAACASTKLAQVGASESSKSAINALAGEFKARMVFLRSAGAVISTRRSCKSGGGGATCQSPSRMARVSGAKSGSAPSSIFCCATTRAARISSRRGAKVRAKSATKARADGVKIIAASGDCVSRKKRKSGVFIFCSFLFFPPAGEDIATQHFNPRCGAKKTAIVATVAANRLGVSARPAARRLFWRRGFARRKRAFRLDATAIRARDRNRAGACSPKHGIRASPLAGDRARPRRLRNRQRRKSARRKRSASCSEGKNRGGHSAKFGFVASARRAAKNRAARLRAKS